MGDLDDLLRHLTRARLPLHGLDELEGLAVEVADGSRPQQIVVEHPLPFPVVGLGHALFALAHDRASYQYVRLVPFAAVTSLVPHG